MKMHRLATVFGVTVVLMALLRAGLASANSCSPALPQLHPGWPPEGSGTMVSPPPSPRVAVGRLCTIQLHTPTTGMYGARLAPEDLVITSGGQEIAVTISPAEDLTRPQLHGCPQRNENFIRQVPYQRYLLTPKQPLPAGQQIQIGRRNWSTALVTFETTDKLDAEGCEPHAGPPDVGGCSPPIQDCGPIEVEAGMGDSVDAGSADSAATAPDSGPADGPSSQSPDAAAKATDGEPTTSDGCSLSGLGAERSASGGVLAAAVAALVLAWRRSPRRR